MATINGSTNSNLWTFKLEAYETSYSIASNTSVVRVDVYIGRTSTRSYCGGTFNGSITVDGGVQGFSGTIPYPTYIDGGAWYYTGVTRDFTVGHNNDGTKSASVSASWGADFNPSSANASGNLGLTNIPRQAKITNSCVSFTDEENPWFTYTNPANTTMSCWLEINPNGEHLATRTLSGTGGTYTWTLTNEERDQLRAKIPNSNTATCRIGLYSTLAGTTYASYQDRTFRIVNANPTFTNFSYKDNGRITPTMEVTTTLTGNNNRIIKGYNSLRVTTAGDVLAQKGATLSYLQIGNKTKQISGDAPYYIDYTDYLNQDVILNVVDSRGNITTVTKTIPSYSYKDYFDVIKGNITVERGNNGVGEVTTLNFSGEFWNNNFGATQNELTISYRYKKTTDSSWTTGTTTLTPTINNNNFSYSGQIAGDTASGFDINYSYNLKVRVSDKATYVDFETMIPSGKPAIAVHGNKVALGDKYDTSLGGIQLWGDVYINGTRIN